MRYVRIALLACAVAGLAMAATFGKVVPIGGHMSDLALDSRRGVLYVANFTANRIEVLSTLDHKLQNPIYVPQQPATIALSPDGRFLVIGHYPGAGQDSAVTILDLDGNQRQTLALTSTPFAVAFGNGPSALIVTARDFQILEPLTGTLRALTTHDRLPLAGENLPISYPNFPPDIVKASTGVSGDGELIYVLAQAAGSAAIVQYRVADAAIGIVGVTTTPPLGPRVISANYEGTRILAGWALVNPAIINLAQIPYVTGDFEIGSHAFDWARDRIYVSAPTGAQATTTPTPAPTAVTTADGPVLHVLDTDNLTVRQRIRIRENLAGRTVFSRDMQEMYSISDSGVTIFPIGSLDRAPRVVSLQEDVLVRGNACDRRIITREIDIVDPSGGRVGFSIEGGRSGVSVFPVSGVTPAKVRIEVDPTAFQNEKGTVVVPLAIESAAAVNIPKAVRLLVNVREPEQRGLILNMPGKLVDLLADPVRDRFYVLRQDTNEVLVFNGTTLARTATFRTGNTPTQMAITWDNRYMIVGADNSQIAHVFDLETLEPDFPIIFPPGHYPRSIAVASDGILASVRSASGPHTIDRINFETRTAIKLSSLGIYTNSISADTVLQASPSGRMVVVAMPDGNMLLYDAEAGTFVAARKTDAAGGTLAAMTDDTFIVDNKVLNAALVTTAELEKDTGQSSGFAFADGFGMRTTTSAASAPGVIQRLDGETLLGRIRPVRMVESPLNARTLKTSDIGVVGQTILPFIRTLAPLSNRNSVVSLSVSGVSVLPWNYDAAVATPVLSRVFNATDGSNSVGLGSPIVVEGTNLSSTTTTNYDVPVPTTAGESCLTVNGTLLPVFTSSPDSIRAQLPFNVSGRARMVLRTPGGTSNPLEITIHTAAPAVARETVPGQESVIASVFRYSNNSRVTLSNPIHPEDIILIRLSGLGLTSPPVEAGQVSPADPIATTVAPPAVTLGGAPVELHFAGLLPNEIAMYGIVGKVPYWVPTGLEIPLSIQQGTQSTTLNVRVVK